MLQKIGSQMSFQTFAKRFFDMVYGKHSISLKVNFAKCLVTFVSQHLKVPLQSFFSTPGYLFGLFSTTLR